MMILTNKMTRVFGIAFLFAALLLALFNSPSLKGNSSIPTASADAVSISAKFDPAGTNPTLFFKGDSTTKGHAGEVVVNSLEQALVNPASISQGVIIPGKVYSKDVTFTKGFDSASVSLYQALTNSTNIPCITFTFQKPNAQGGVSDFYQVTYSNVRITSIDQSGTPNSGVVETVIFLPSKTTWTNLSNAASYSWDFTINKAS